jgi:Ni/Fe-hydrogenase 1 B-type cytochrome subunit
MQAETLRRVPVWSKWLRLTHWAMTALLAALLLTGLLAREAPRLATAARDYHYLAGHLMAFVLLARLSLLFLGNRGDLLRALIPGRVDLAAARAMLLFYVTRGRAPMPKWYAHNPFWAPIYLAIFIVLAAQLLSGYGFSGNPVFDPEATHALHALGANILLGFALLHTLAVFWHDAKGTGSDISAMVSGQRIFVIAPPANATDRKVIDIALQPAEPRE